MTMTVTLPRLVVMTSLLSIRSAGGSMLGVDVLDNYFFVLNFGDPGGPKNTEQSANLCVIICLEFRLSTGEV